MDQSTYQQPKDAQGRFVNEFHPFVALFSDVWKWQRSVSEYRMKKKVELSVNPTPFTPVNLISSLDVLPDDCIVWL